MRRRALVIRVQYDDTGRLQGQLVDPLDGGRFSFAGLSELWNTLQSCLGLPATSPPAPAGEVARAEPLVDNAPPDLAQ